MVTSTHEAARIAAQLDADTQPWIASIASGKLDLDEVLNLILEQARVSLEADAASVLLVDPDTDGLMFRAVASDQSSHLLRRHIPPGRGIAGWVFGHGQPVRVADVSMDPRFYHVLDQTAGFHTHSILAVPLKIHERTLGVLEVLNKRHGAFSEADEHWLVSVSSWAAITIENARLTVEATQRAQELTLRDELSRRLADAADLRDLLARVPDVLCALSGAVRCAIVPAGPMPTAADLVEREKDPHTPVSAGPWWAAYAIGPGTEPRIVPDTGSDGLGDSSLLILPLLNEAEALGWVVFGHTRPGYFSATDAERLTPLVQQVALAMHKAQFAAHLAELVEARTEALRRQQRQLDLFHEVASDAVTAPDSTQLLRSVARQILSTLALHRVRIWAARQKALTLIADVGAPGADPTAYIQNDEHPSLSCLDTESRGAIDRDPRIERRPSDDHPVIRLRLVVKSDCYGVLEVQAASGRPLTAQDRHSLETIASRLALTLKNAQLFDEIARGQREWEATFSAIAEGVVVHDDRLVVRRANRALAELMGRSIEEIVGHDVTAVICPTQPDLSAALRADATGALKMEIAEPDTGRILAIRGYPGVWTPFGTSGRVLVVRDVTEEHRWRARMVQTEKLASLGQLSAGIAHEINNPLGFIHSNLNTLSRYVSDVRTLFANYRDVLERHGLLAECEPADVDFLLQDLDAAVTESQEGVERVQGIVIGLKNFARADEGSGMKSADFHQVLETALKIAWNEIKYKATVEKDYGELPAVRCNPYRLGQVFINLLVNAAQAIVSDGRITLRTRSVEDWVEFSIQDNGSGIEPENLSKLFDPFFTTKEVGLGTGLGLSVVYGIVQEHGGQIDVASRVGQGTTFTIALPVSGPTV